MFDLLPENGNFMGERANIEFQEDSKGNVRALSVGVAVLEVKYKQSIFPKSIKIYVIPKESEEDIKDDSGHSNNSNTNTQDNSEELELPF